MSILPAQRPHALLLLGPTGAGKTPLGQSGEKRGLHGHPCRHFDFGARLRQAAAEAHTSISPHARQIVHDVLAAGRLLLPTEFFVATEILASFLADTPHETVVILNGLPRSIAQAKALEPLIHVRLLVQLQADPPLIQARIRRNSGGDRSGRSDDTPEAVAQRLALYQQKTMPLVEYYQSLSVPVVPVTVALQSDPAQIWNHIPPM